MTRSGDTDGAKTYFTNIGLSDMKPPRAQYDPPFIEKVGISKYLSNAL